MALALVAVAAATYVATAPGGLKAGSPTARQFAALKRQVARLQKQVKSVKNEADAGLGVSLLCIMHKPVGVDQVGTSSSGYLFGPPQTAPTAVTAAATTALDLAPSTEASPQHNFYELNTSKPVCVQIAQQASTLTVEQAVAAYAAGH
jgi:hypothetical protein